MSLDTTFRATFRAIFQPSNGVLSVCDLVIDACQGEGVQVEFFAFCYF